MGTLTLTFPQMVAHGVTGAFTAYYPENIIFKALSAALSTSTITVTVP